MGLHPGRASRGTGTPDQHTRSTSHRRGKGVKPRLVLTSFDLLVHLDRLDAPIDLLVRQDSELRACLRPSETVVAIVHSTLQGVSFPSEDVIGVMPIAGSIVKDKRRRMTDSITSATYGSPWLRTRGWLPSVGHMSLNGLVSQKVS